MVALHPGQRGAIHEYVKGVPIDPGSFGYNLLALQTLEDKLLNVSPWRELLPGIDLMNVIRSCVKKFESRIPQGYTGSIENSPIADQIPEIENELVRFLESLPRPYFVCFQMPRFPKYGVAIIKLSDNVEIVDTSAPDFPQELLKPANALVAVASEKFERDSAYLRFSVPGYAYASINSYSVGRAYSQLKELVFLGTHDGVILEKDLADVVMLTNYPLFDLVSLHALVYNPNEHTEESYRIRLPDETSKYLRWLRIDEKQVMNPSRGLLATTTPPATTKEKADALSMAFLFASRFLDIDQVDVNAERIRTAMEWYFDAETSENQTVSFLQRCIGLEAILGLDDDDRARGLTERLSDRFAYLLGKTSSERTELKDRFIKVYGKRSDVVHARRSRLSLDDFRSNSESREMLSDVIRKEVGGLLKALREQT